MIYRELYVKGVEISEPEAFACSAHYGLASRRIILSFLHIGFSINGLEIAVLFNESHHLLVLLISAERLGLFALLKRGTQLCQPVTYHGQHSLLARHHRSVSNLLTVLYSKTTFIGRLWPPVSRSYSARAISH